METKYDYLVKCDNIDDFKNIEFLIRNKLIQYTDAIGERWCYPLILSGTTDIYCEVPTPNRLISFPTIPENINLFEQLVNQQISLDNFKIEIEKSTVDIDLKNIIQKLNIVDRTYLIVDNNFDDFLI